MTDFAHDMKVLDELRSLGCLDDWLSESSASLWRVDDIFKAVDNGTWLPSTDFVVALSNPDGGEVRLVPARLLELAEAEAAAARRREGRLAAHLRRTAPVRVAKVAVGATVATAHRVWTETRLLQIALLLALFLGGVWGVFAGPLLVLDPTLAAPLVMGWGATLAVLTAVLVWRWRTA